MRRIALLRGVNLGARQLVMSELRDALARAGFQRVRTLIASGNIVLDAKEKGAKLEATLEQAIATELGLETDVFVRDPDELDAVIAANPFKAFAKTNPTYLVLYLMRSAPSAAEQAAMAANEGPEEVKPGKRCLYIKYPNGQGRSKLRLPKLGTARNWNTVTKLAAMARDE